MTQLKDSKSEKNLELLINLINSNLDYHKEELIKLSLVHPGGTTLDKDYKDSITKTTHKYCIAELISILSTYNVLNHNNE